MFFFSLAVAVTVFVSDLIQRVEFAALVKNAKSVILMVNSRIAAKSASQVKQKLLRKVENS